MAEPGGHVDSSTVDRFEQRIPSDVRYIEPVVERVASVARAREFSPRQCALNVPVALTEALSNAILRGNRGMLGQHVEIRVRISDVTLVLEVVDQGQGFDLETCTVDPTTPDHIEREDGRGLYLMSRLVDRVERYMDGGNVVRLTLHRA